MPAKLTPADREAIAQSKERTHVLAARHDVSVSRIKEIRAAAGWSRKDDKGGALPGTPKHPNSGRLPGTPNKRTVYARQILEDHGVDPVAMLAKTMADEDNVPLDVRVDCAKALLPYVYPKLSAVEVTGRDGGPVEVERDKMLVQRMMGDDVVVARLEALIIEQTEPARAERALEPYEGTNA
ncbi:MAG: hypothetical protein LAP87_15380 [Acidobacteriia bacterium]|nr:hypothetical protein [Terriglobia bacterium]